MKTAVTKSRVIDPDKLGNFASELSIIEKIDPEVAEQFSQDVEAAVMRFHRQRSRSQMIVDARGDADVSKPLRVDVEPPKDGYGTVYLLLESGYGYAQVSLVLSDAQKLHNELGAAIEELRAFLAEPKAVSVKGGAK